MSFVNPDDAYIKQAVPAESGSPNSPENERGLLKQRFFDTATKIVSAYPYPETREAIADFVLGKISTDELGGAFERAQEDERKNEEFRKELERSGVITYHDGVSIIDVDEIETEEKKKTLADAADRIFERRSIPAALDRALFGLPVLTKQAYESGDRDPRPFFYAPKTLNEALNPEEIKKAKFFFLRPEILPNQGKPQTPESPQFPSILDPITYFDVETAAAIYHPRYGDGYRDEDGTLKVRDHTTREYKKMSLGWMKDQPGIRDSSTVFSTTNGERKVQMYGSPRVFLEHGGSTNLVNNKLLLPGDFRILSKSARESGIRLEKEHIPKNGRIMLNGVIHFVGWQFADDRFIELAPGLGGIVHTDTKTGEEKLMYTFRVFSANEVPHKVRHGTQRASGKKITMSYVGGADNIELTQYKPEDYHPPKRADEEESQWEDRVRATEGFNRLLKFTSSLPQDERREFTRFPLSDQRIIAAALQDVPAQQREHFLKKHGVEGLRVMIGADYGKDFVRKALALSEVADSPAKYAIEEQFEWYASITSLAGEFESIGNEISNNLPHLPQELRELLPQELKEAILRRATDLISASHLVSVEKVETNLTPNQIAAALMGLERFLKVMRAFSTDDEVKLSFLKRENGSYIFRADELDDEDRSEVNWQYILRIFLRPEEHQKEGQARINFTLDFDAPELEDPVPRLSNVFEQETRYTRGNKIKTESVLRIGLDRDTRGGGEEISLDVGRAAYKGEDFERTGDPLGNALTLATKMGHHNPKSIDQRFAKQEVFRELVRGFQKFLDENFADNAQRS